AADSVGKALLGNTKALKSLGIDGFKPTGDRARDLATLQDLLQSKTKGAAQAQLDAAGPGATLKKSMDELQESVGGLLLPVLQKAAEVGATITDFLTNMDGPTKILVLSVGALAGAVVALNLAQSVWTTLTEAATVAQAALNLVMSANPIALVAIGIAGLVAAGVLLVKNWDTVKGAFSATFGWIKDRFDDFIGLFDGLPGKIGAAVKGLAGVITAPFRLEFNAVSGLWNNSVGSLSFHVPDWVPGLGGKGFSFPKLPTLAQGGITTGPTVALIGDNPGGREAVIPLPPGADTGDIGGGPTGPIVIQLVVGKQVLTEVVHSGLLDKKQRTGTLGLS
ncbi:MAG TPA: hypothetical protein VHL53_13090, partial [Acidimicrobiia bacterium]|nr:hypothetical protein [Acidimicrobiia bacterium]